MSVPFAKRHPYWFVAAAEVVVIIIYLLAGTIAHFMALSNLGLYGLANLGLTVVVAGYLTATGSWRAIGFRRPEKATDLWFFAIPFIPVLVNFIPGIQVSSLGYLLEVLAITLMVGFVEEGVFRGVMLQAIKSHGLWKAAIITSVLFGLTHAMNMLAGKSVIEDAAQILYAMAIGFGFSALVLRKGIIWPLVLAHFLIDFVNFIGTPGYVYPAGWEVALVLGMTILFAGYGVYVMLWEPKAAPKLARASG